MSKAWHITSRKTKGHTADEDQTNSLVVERSGKHGILSRPRLARTENRHHQVLTSMRHSQTAGPPLGVFVALPAPLRAHVTSQESAPILGPAMPFLGVNCHVRLPLSNVPAPCPLPGARSCPFWPQLWSHEHRGGCP